MRKRMIPLAVLAVPAMATAAAAPSAGEPSQAEANALVALPELRPDGTRRLVTRTALHRTSLPAQASSRERSERRRARAKRAERKRRERRQASVPPQLEAIARCESGGNPRAVSASGQYRGKYQFSRATWAAVGGKGDPAAAPEVEQDRRAAILYARSGPGQWPVCAS